MNIFATSRDPAIAAHNLDDKRVVKMILETAQLLSAAVTSHGVRDEELYKATHLYHPCAIWTRTSRQHFHWLVLHGLALGRVYRKAYGKTHASVEIIHMCNEYKHIIPDNGWEDWANCTDDKSEKDVITAYINYMNRKWNNDGFVPTWKNRNKPEWRQR